MRKDILNAIKDLKGVKKMINKSELARRFGCSINTVNKYLEIQNTDEKVKRKYSSKLDEYKGIIIEKVDDFSANGRSIYNFIKEKAFLQNSLGMSPETAVQCSNFIGESLDICKELGFRGALLVGHIGKLVKIAGGMMNTHSKYGDCRMEILAAHAAAAGLKPEQVGKLLQCVACDDALAVISDDRCRRAALESLTEKIGFHLQCRGGETLETGAIVYSLQYGILGKTENAETLWQTIKEGT